MKKDTKKRPVEKQSAKRPLDAREYPLARDARGSAHRDEIRAQAPVISAPRQTRRPAERSRQKRAHTR